MKKCWASPLGGCVEKRSREHYVTESMWTGPDLQVTGMPWLKGETKTIGLGSLTAHILCRKHNSDLSDVDQAASDAFREIERMTRLQNRRTAARPHKWKRIRFDVKGPLLERWFLKTAINLGTQWKTDRHWVFDSSPLSQPSRALVDLAFGHTEFVKPMGLYAAAAVGDSVVPEERFEATTLLNDASEVVAIAFTFYGFRFVLWLDPKGPASSISVAGPPKPDRAMRDLIYHLAFVKSEVGGYFSHYLDFMWPGRKIPHWLARG